MFFIHFLRLHIFYCWMHHSIAYLSRTLLIAFIVFNFLQLKIKTTVNKVHSHHVTNFFKKLDLSCKKYLSVQFSSVAQSYLTLCNPVNRSTPGLPVHHQLLEFTETHVHRVSDAIQPSHPLSSPSPPAPNPSQHQGLFQ